MIVVVVEKYLWNLDSLKKEVALRTDDDDDDDWIDKAVVAARKQEATKGSTARDRMIDEC